MSSFPGILGPFAGGYGFDGAFGGYQPAAPLAPAAAQDPAPADPVKPADPVERGNAAFGSWGNGLAGFEKAPPGTTRTYALMRAHPAVVMAWAVATGAIYGGNRTFEIRKPRGVQRQDGNDTELANRKDAVEEALERQWNEILYGLEFLNFGSFTSEIIWDRVNGLTVPVEFRPFAPMECQLYRDEAWQFAGFGPAGSSGVDDKNYRDERYAFHAVNDPHMNAQHLYGRPRAENAREDWWRSVQSELLIDKLEIKASGIQLLLQATSGAKFADATGKPQDPGAAMKAMAQVMEAGRTVGVASNLFSGTSIEKNPELAKIPLIAAQQFDWGNNGPAMDAGNTRLGRRDRSIMQAYHRPTQEAMDSVHGTKAQAAAHGQIGIVDSERIANEFYAQFSRQVVNRMLVTNWGAAAANSVSPKPVPLTDDTRAYLQQLSIAMLGNQAAGELVTEQIDVPAQLKALEVKTLDPKVVEANRQAKQQQAADAMKAMQQAKPAGGFPPAANGNGRGMTVNAG